MIKIKNFKPDFLISGIILMIILAWIFPGIGENKSTIPLAKIIYYGISLLFFFYGLQLEPKKLINDLKNWRVHFLIQSITYIIFPVIVLLFYPLFIHSPYKMLWYATFFLATLPSTVSSSVVMVSIAKGNIPTAIFNASISGIIGVFLTPLWISLIMGTKNSGFTFSQVIVDLTIQIIIPLIIGLLFHQLWGKWAQKNKKKLSTFDKIVILCIVYKSFSHSFSSGIFNSIAIPQLTVLILCIIILFFVVFKTSQWLAKRFHFSNETQITIQFCGSKKSLVHGSILASVLFAGSPYGSLFIVPVMIYHAFQLFYISIVARRYAQNC